MSRRFAGAGQFRRGGRQAAAGGIAYLLDYNDATFTRASEAAYVDPRESWAFENSATETFDATTYPAEYAAFGAIDDDVSTWTNTGTCDVTGSQADPFAGTGAYLLDDDSASVFESRTSAQTSDSLAIGDVGRVQVYIKKDSDETRFPEVSFQRAGAASYFTVQINTSTGASAVRAAVGWTDTDHTVTSYDASWWLLEMRVVMSTAGTLRVIYAPAAGTTLGVYDAAATGSATFYHPAQVFTHHAAWATIDVPRIFSDGAVLIEAARTNLVDEARDANSLTAGSGATVTSGYSDGPDGATGTGDRQEVTSGGYSRYSNNTGLTADRWHAASMYTKQAVASSFEGGLEHTATVGDPWDDLTLGASWKRVEAAATLTLGDTTTSVVPADGRTITAIGSTASAEDVVHDLLQLEEAAFVSSPIRTAGATATRAVEDMSCATAAWGAGFTTVGFEVDVWPLWPSTVTHGASIIYVGNLGADYLRFFNNSIQFASTGGTVRNSATFAWAVGDKVTIRVEYFGNMTISVNDVEDQVVDISGAGNGDWSTPTTWRSDTSARWPKC